MTDYALMSAQLEAFAGEDPFYIPLLSNASALLFHGMPDVNWTGFYLFRGGRLVLGPFQGKPACIHILPGRGVCGTAAANDATLRVDDVHAFPGHIACDSASESEIVVPLHHGGEVIGVMDLDSPVLSRFTADDQRGLEAFAAVLERYLVFF